MSQQCTTIMAQQALAHVFLRTGVAILGLGHGLLTRSYARSFRENFKWGPGRVAYLYSLIRGHPILPQGYSPKHLLWTLNFLLSYEKERRRCHSMKADWKTIRKFVWPTIIVISTLVPRFVSAICSLLTMRIIKILFLNDSHKDSMGKQTHW